MASNNEWEMASSLFEDILSECLDTLKHELIHLAQSLLEVGILGDIRDDKYQRRPGPGMPSRRIMTRDITQNTNSPYMLPPKYEKKRQQLEDMGLLNKVHEFDDVEFYTRLSDDVLKFKRDNRRMRGPDRKKAITEFVGIEDEESTSPWFRLLKNHAPKKWRKAVKEFTKMVL